MGFEIFKKIYDLITTLNEKVKTENYREQVLNQLEEIEKEISSFYSDFKMFEDKQGLNALLESMGNPIATVNRWYEGDFANDSVNGWLNNKYDAPASSTQKEIESNARRFLVGLYRAITKEEALKPGQELWMTYFHDWIVDSKNEYTWGLPFLSPIESLYYYHCYTMALQGKIYTAAVWAKVQDVISDYKKALPLNLADEGSNIQSQVNEWNKTTAFDGQSWSEVFLNRYSYSNGSEQIPIEIGDNILLNGWPDLGDDGVHVIYDFGFLYDKEQDAYNLQVCYGNLNTLGYVEPIGTAIAKPKTKISMFKGADSSDPIGIPISNVNFMAGASSNEVIINMKLINVGGIGDCSNSIGFEILTAVPKVSADGNSIEWTVFPNDQNSSNIIKYAYKTNSTNPDDYIKYYNNNFAVGLMGVRSQHVSYKGNYPPLNQAYIKTYKGGSTLNNMGAQKFHLNCFGKVSV